MNTKIALSILFLTASALAAPGVYDVSGSDGRDGSNGHSGHNGSPGNDGESAGSIVAEVGFVSSDQKQIYVRGQMRSARGNTKTINDIYPTDTFTGLLFRANGGKGGDGGAGGEGADGRRGSDGRSGSSFGFDLDGKDGDDGGPGSNGGNGSDGGDAGNAGTVQVTLAQDSRLLSPLISVQADPGRGGDAGRAGRGGDGGAGGSGGSGACDHAGTSMDPMKDYKLAKCGSRGSSGSRGRSGSSGHSGREGRDGSRGSSSLVYSNGAQVRGGYKVQISRAEIREFFQDGIFEPGEKIEIKSLTFRNVGDAVLPATSLVLTFANGEKYIYNSGDVTPGDTVVYQLPKPVVLDSQIVASGSSVSLRLNHLRTDLINGAAINVSEPVSLGQVNSPVVTSATHKSVLSIRVVNASKISYGASGDAKRKIQVVVTVPEGSPLILDEKAVELQKQKVIEIPSIAARSDSVINLPIHVRNDAKLGHNYRLEVAVKVQDLAGSANREINSTSPTIAYTLDPSNAIQFSQSVVGLRSICRYPSVFNKERILSKIWITKAANSSEVQIQYDLKYSFSKSYVYKTDINSLGGVLNTIIANGQLTSEEVSFVMNSAVSPLTRPNQNHKESWELSGCNTK